MLEAVPIVLQEAKLGSVQRIPPLSTPATLGPMTFGGSGGAAGGGYGNTNEGKIIAAAFKANQPGAAATYYGLPDFALKGILTAYPPPRLKQQWLKGIH